MEHQNRQIKEESNNSIKQLEEKLRELQLAHEQQLSHLTSQHDSKVRELQDALQNALSSSSQSEEESQQKTQQLLDSIRNESSDKENLWKEEKAKLQQQQAETERVHSESQAEIERQLGVAQEELKKAQELLLERDSQVKVFAEEKISFQQRTEELQEQLRGCEDTLNRTLKEAEDKQVNLETQIASLEQDLQNERTRHEKLTQSQQQVQSENEQNKVAILEVMNEILMRNDF